MTVHASKICVLLVNVVTCIQVTPQEAYSISSDSARASVFHYLQPGLQSAIVSPATMAPGDFPRALPGLPSAELLWQHLNVWH